MGTADATPPADGDTLRELRESGAPQHLRLITDSLPVLIAHCDATGRYLFVNRPYAARFGREPEAVIGLTIGEVVGPAAAEAIRPYAGRALEGERVIFEIEVPYADLGLRTMRCEYVPATLDRGGAVESVIATIVDVTDQRRIEGALRDRESHFRAAFELSAVGQAMVGLDRRYLLVNDRYCAMTGYTREELMDLRFENLTHPDDVARDFLLGQSLLRGEAPVVTSEKRYIRKQGDVVWVRVHATLLKDGSGTPLGAFSMIEDITEQKRAAEERETLLVRERVARLAAEEANRTKDDFLATLSHELRTPLNAILGWTQMLQRKVLEPDRVDAALEAVARNARKQARLVDDLLDLSRIAAGQLKLSVERAPLAGIIDAAIDTIRPALDAKRLTLTAAGMPAPLVVEADPIRLQQVFWNLLSNAAKFTPEGGHVSLSCDASSDEVSVIVRDTGIGMEASFVPRIFSRFEQADQSTTRSHDGVGLGLAIVRHLVELHGGTVTAQSDGPGLGATFTVTLPLAQAAPAGVL